MTMCLSMPLDEQEAYAKPCRVARLMSLPLATMQPCPPSAVVADDAMHAITSQNLDQLAALEILLARRRDKPSQVRLKHFVDVIDRALILRPEVIIFATGAGDYLLHFPAKGDHFRCRWSVAAHAVQVLLKRSE